MHNPLVATNIMPFNHATGSGGGRMVMVLLLLVYLELKTYGLIIKLNVSLLVWEVPRHSTTFILEQLNPEEPSQLEGLVRLLQHPLGVALDLNLANDEWKRKLVKAIILRPDLHEIILTGDFLENFSETIDQVFPFTLKFPHDYHGILWPENLSKIGHYFSDANLIQNMIRHRHADFFSTYHEWNMEDPWTLDHRAWTIFPIQILSDSFNKFLLCKIKDPKTAKDNSGTDHPLLLVKLWQRYYIQNDRLGLSSIQSISKLVDHPIAKTISYFGNTLNLMASPLILVKEIIELTRSLENDREGAGWVLDTILTLLPICESREVCLMMKFLMDNFPLANQIPAYQLCSLASTKDCPNFLKECENFNHLRWNSYFVNLRMYHRNTPLPNEPFDSRLLKWQVQVAKNLNVDYGVINVTNFSLDIISSVFYNCDPMLNHLVFPRSVTFRNHKGKRQRVGTFLQLIREYLSFIKLVSTISSTSLSLEATAASAFAVSAAAASATVGAAASVAATTTPGGRRIFHDIEGIHIKAMLSATLYYFTRTGCWDNTIISPSLLPLWDSNHKLFGETLSELYEEYSKVPFGIATILPNLIQADSDANHVQSLLSFFDLSELASSQC